MVPCSRCGRYIRSAEASCPFCEVRFDPVARKVMAAIGAVVTPMVLAACYGGPPGVDADGDGWEGGSDCNDNDAAIHPDAGEICDDTIDNDCDEQIDAADPDCGDSGDSGV